MIEKYYGMAQNDTTWHKRLTHTKHCTKGQQMLKISDAALREIQAIYERGDSLRSISERFRIPFKTIDNWAKKGNWKKGGLAPLIADSVRIRREFNELDSVKQRVVTESVTEIVDKKEWLDNCNLTIAGLLMKKIATDQEAVTYQDLNAASSTLGRTKDNIFGKGPDVAVQINNTPTFDVGKLSSAALAEIIAAKDAGKE